MRAMSEEADQAGGKRHLSELFAALKAVVADSPRIQEMIRAQEQDNRQVLLNMSSVLRMVEREKVARAKGVPTERYEPKVVAGWMMGDGTLVQDNEDHAADARRAEEDEPEGDPEADPEPRGARPAMNFFDRAFLKSLKISS
jgi:hypothetical protein